MHITMPGYLLRLIRAAQLYGLIEEQSCEDLINSIH